jgi:hypothetical protein
MGAGGGVETNYIKELQARREMQEFQIKRQQTVVDKVLKDPIVAINDSKLAQTAIFESTLKTALDSGATSPALNAEGKPVMTKDSKGKEIPVMAKIITAPQAKMLATSYMQMMRPGARISNDDGSISDDTAGSLGNIPFLGALLNAANTGTSVKLTHDDILGMYTAEQVLKNTTIRERNARIAYHQANDNPANKEFYDTLYSKPIPGVDDVPIVTADGKPIAQSVADSAVSSQAASAKENLTRTMTSPAGQALNAAGSQLEHKPRAAASDEIPPTNNGGM